MGGSILGVLMGATRSSDYSSYELQYLVDIIFLRGTILRTILI